MTLLLGLLFFLALAAIALVDALYGDDDRARGCPFCGLVELYPRGDDAYSCAACGARYRRTDDGRLVPA